MAIFGNKKKSVIERLDELLAEIDSLPEEEQEKVWAHFDDAKEEMEGDSAEDKGKPDTEEEIAKAKEDAESKGEKPTQAEIDMSVGEQEELDGNEDSQSAKDRVKESEGEEKTIEEKREEKTEAEEEMTEEKGKTEETAEEKVNDALVARIAALEEKVAKMLESEEKEDFGMKASLPQGNESDEHYDAVMRGYAKGAWRNYK